MERDYQITTITVYTNSLIATLNARKGVIQAIEERTDNKFYSFQTLTNVSPHKSRVDQQQQQQTNNIAIRIDTTKEARVETSDEKVRLPAACSVKQTVNNDVFTSLWRWGTRNWKLIS
jgi:hypothetical protein